MTKKCPCYSGKDYQECCQPFHQGKLPSTALELMRSRYSAYAMGLCQYLIDTTHPEHPNYKKDPKRWIKDIQIFSTKTTFDNLEILEFIDGQDVAYVTFKASLHQGAHDASFTEKSLFHKVNGKWLYLSGEVS